MDFADVTAANSLLTVGKYCTTAHSTAANCPPSPPTLQPAAVCGVSERRRCIRIALSLVSAVNSLPLLMPSSLGSPDQCVLVAGGVHPDTLRQNLQ